MRFEKVFFTNDSGQRLAARLDLPETDPPRAWALFAHCFTCTKDLKAAANISRAMTGEGVGVLRFDFTGLGESEGVFSETTFSSNVDDLVAAARFLEQQHAPPRVLVGHSLGGAAVLQAAGRIASARAVVTIGAPADPRHVVRHLEGVRQEIETTGEAPVELAGRTFRIGKSFLEDLEAARMAETIRRLDRALLVFHAPLDDVVGIENAGRIFQAARHPKSFISLDRADHLLTDSADSQYVGRLIAAWAAPYLTNG